MVIYWVFILKINHHFWRLIIFISFLRFLSAHSPWDLPWIALLPTQFYRVLLLWIVQGGGIYRDEGLGIFLMISFLDVHSGYPIDRSDSAPMENRGSPYPHRASHSIWVYLEQILDHDESLRWDSRWDSRFLEGRHFFWDIRPTYEHYCSHSHYSYHRRYRRDRVRGELIRWS